MSDGIMSIYPRDDADESDDDDADDSTESIVFVDDPDSRGR